jgi:hypothetical protein
MNEGTETGLSTISLEKQQCSRRDSAGPTERRKGRRRSNLVVRRENARL